MCINYWMTLLLETKTFLSYWLSVTKEPRRRLSILISSYSTVIIFIHMLNSMLCFVAERQGQLLRIVTFQLWFWFLWLIVYLALLMMSRLHHCCHIRQPFWMKMCIDVVFYRTWISLICPVLTAFSRLNKAFCFILLLEYGTFIFWCLVF